MSWAETRASGHHSRAPRASPAAAWAERSSASVMSPRNRVRDRHQLPCVRRRSRPSSPGPWRSHFGISSDLGLDSVTASGHPARRDGMSCQPPPDHPVFLCDHCDLGQGLGALAGLQVIDATPGPVKITRIDHSLMRSSRNRLFNPGTVHGPVLAVSYASSQGLASPFPVAGLVLDASDPESWRRPHGAVQGLRLAACIASSKSPILARAEGNLDQGRVLQSGNPASYRADAVPDPERLGPSPDRPSRRPRQSCRGHGR